MKYRAFISYRRKDAGSVARWLRRRLLGFRLPREVLDGISPERRLDTERRVGYFLDTSYQSANEDFWTANIEPALREAECLIVLSSPSALEHRSDGTENWVGREIDTFLKVNGDDEGRRRILLALAPGASTERFPGRLADLGSQWDWADFRELSPWRFFRPGIAERIDDAFLKIVARLFEVPQQLLPALRQEEARRRARWRLGTAAVAGVVLVALSAALGWAVVAQKDAERQRDIADKQRAIAEQRLADAQRNDSMFKATQSRRLFASGDINGALRVALQALPTDIAANERPYVPAAEEALLQAIIAASATLTSGEVIPASALPWGSSVNAVASRDGHLFAVPGVDTISVWDMIGGKQIHRLDLPQFCGTPLMAFSGDNGTIAAVCGATGGLRVWHLTDGNPIYESNEYKNPLSLQLDQRGQRLAVACDRGFADVIEVKTKRRLAHLTAPTPGFLQARLSPDGRRLMAWTGTWAALWEVDRDQAKAEFGADGLGTILSAAFSADSRLLALGTATFLAQIRDGVTGAAVGTFKHSGPVGHVVFNQSATRLFTAELLPLSDFDPGKDPDQGLKRLRNARLRVPLVLSADDSILVHVTDHVRAFDIKGNGQAALDLPLDAEKINVRDGRSGQYLTSLAADLGSQAVLTAEGTLVFTYINAVRRWTLGNLQGVRRMAMPATPRGIIFSNDGTSGLLFAGMGGPAQIGAYGPLAMDRISAIGEGARAGTVLALNRHRALVDRGAETTLLDLDSGRAIGSWKIDTGLYGAVGAESPCAFSRSFSNRGRVLVPGQGALDFPADEPTPSLIHFVGSGCRLLAGYDDGSYRLWDVEDGKLRMVRALFTGERPVSAGAVFDVITAGFADGRVVLLDRDGKLRGQALKSPTGAASTAQALTDGGRRLVVLYADATLVVWDTESGKPIAKSRYFGGETLGFAPSYDGKLAVIYGPQSPPQLWDIEGGRLIAQLEDRQAGTNAIAFSRDGKRLATASVDKYVRIWDSADGHVVAKLDAGDRVNDLAWTPDGGKLALTLSQGVLELLDVARGQALIDIGRKIAAAMPADPAGAEPR